MASSSSSTPLSRLFPTPDSSSSSLLYFPPRELPLLREVRRFNSRLFPLAFDASCRPGVFDAGSYGVSSANEGGAGARGMRYEGSAAGARGDGKDVLLDCVVVVGGDMETNDDGRDGNNCDKRSDPPEVFLRVSGGRVCEPIAGEPARRAIGTPATDEFMSIVGEPTCSGDGMPAMSSRVSKVRAEVAAYRETIRSPGATTCTVGDSSHTSKEVIKVMQERAHEVESHSICYTPAAEGCLSTFCGSELQPHHMPPLFRLDVTIWGPERQPTPLAGNSSPVVPGSGKCCGDKRCSCSPVGWFIRSKLYDSDLVGC